MTDLKHQHFARTISLLGLATLWWVAARMVVSSQLLPGPLRVLMFTWQEVANGALPWNVGITLVRALAAFAVAMLVGGVLGYIAGRFRAVDAFIDTWAVIALNLPLLVVVVLTYIWIGMNDAAAVLAVAIAKAPTIFITVREGARALDPRLDELVVVFRVPLWRRLQRVELPQLMPYLAASARSGLSITWKIVLIVELLGRPNGVGFMLNLYFQDFNVTGILAYGLAFAAIMLIVETAVLQPWERSTNAWRRHA